MGNQPLADSKRKALGGISNTMQHREGPELKRRKIGATPEKKSHKLTTHENTILVVVPPPDDGIILFTPSKDFTADTSGSHCLETDYDNDDIPSELTESTWIADGLGKMTKVNPSL